MSKGKCFLAAAAAGAFSLLASVHGAHALSMDGKEITLRLGSGHPPFLTYIQQLQELFVPKVQERVEKETDYTINFKQHYSGTVVTVFDTLEGVQDGRLDLGGWCVCFDDDKAMAMNFAYFAPFQHPNAVTQYEIGRKLLEQFPVLYEDYEARYNQKLLGLTTFNNYGLLSNFDWESFQGLEGQKILAAGPNLPWVKGGIPVRTSIPKAAQQLSTGVGDAIILFPDTSYKLKLHEAIGEGGVYTVTDFGAVLQINLTMNLDTREKLPPEVVKIIDEVAVEWAEATAKAGERDHEWGLKKLEEAGITVKKIAPEAKQAWAEALSDFPRTRVKDVKDKKNVDITPAMREFIKLNKEAGHTWPVDYEFE